MAKAYILSFLPLNYSFKIELFHFDVRFSLFIFFEIDHVFLLIYEIKIILFYR